MEKSLIDIAVHLWRSSAQDDEPDRIAGHLWQRSGANAAAGDTEKDELYKQIGQLKVELDFLKRTAGLID
jgi:hypothetical protein